MQLTFLVCKRSYVLHSRILILLAFLKNYLCYDISQITRIVFCPLKNSYLMRIHLSLNIWININGRSQIPTWFDGEKKKKEIKISGSWMKKQVKPNVYYDHQLLWNQIFKRREGKITLRNRDTYNRYRLRFFVWVGNF